MKKILLSSLIAVMAVSAANAKIASTDYADAVAEAAQTAATNAAAADATTKANAAEANAIADTKTKIEALDTTVSATEGVVTGVTQADGLITGVSSAKVTSTMIADDAAIAKTQLAAAVQESLTKADNAATTIGTETIAKGDTSAIVNATTLTGAINELSTAVKKVSGGELTLGANAVSTDNILDNAVTARKLSVEVVQRINDKANSADVYTKDDVYTKAEINAELGENGATGQAIATAQDTADDAAAAAAAAQATADAAVVANTAITAGTGTKITYDAKGLVTSSTNLAEGDIPTLSIAKISGLQSALDGKQATLTIDTELNANSTNAVENKAIAAAIKEINGSDAMTSGITAGDVTQIGTNKTAIETLAGTGEGSVNKAITDHIAEITATITGDAGVIKTLSQTAGKVSARRELVTTTELDTTVNTALTNANNAAAFMSSVQGASTDQTQANKAYVLTASKDGEGKMTYTWEEIDRDLLN